MEGGKWLRQDPSAGVACECSTWAGNADTLSMAANSLRCLCPQCLTSPARQTSDGHWSAQKDRSVLDLGVELGPQIDWFDYTFN